MAALAIASVASSHERVVSFAVRGSLSGVSLDVDDADVTITRRRPARAARRAAHRPLRLRPRRRRAAHGGRRRAAPALALPQRGPARVLGELPRGRARQRPGDRPHDERDGDLPRLPRIGARDHAQRRHRRRRLLRLLAGGAGRERRHRRGRGLRAPAADAALERRARCTSRCRPGRYQVEAESASGSDDRQRPRRGGRRAVRHPGAEQLRATCPSRVARDRGPRPRPPPRARVARRGLPRRQRPDRDPRRALACSRSSSAPR